MSKWPLGGESIPGVNFDGVGGRECSIESHERVSLVLTAFGGRGCGAVRMHVMHAQKHRILKARLK